MKVLAFETSCDETAIAILELDNKKTPNLIYEEILSQTKIHIDYGGVVPEIASREHMKNLPILLEQVTKESKTDLDSIDQFAVTTGPGLKGCLLMGLAFSKAIAKVYKTKLVGVNHIEGHILAGLLNNADLKFPYLALVVSGGHTEIVKVKDVGDYEVLSRTIDDAAGEAFDKSAHILGFSYPGGPKLASLADKVNSSKYKLPKVMTTSKDFSFSGLKTAITLLLKNNPDFHNDDNLKAELAWTIQDAIVSNLLDKLKLAVVESGIENILITGGVSANKSLRHRAKAECKNVYFPDFLHCMDNAAMIALVAGLRETKGLPHFSINEVFCSNPL